MRPGRSSASRGRAKPAAGTIIRAAILAALALWLAYLTFASAFTNIAHRRNPELALRFSPHDPEALQTLASARLTSIEALSDPSTAALARQSLEQQALNPQALRILGLIASARGGMAGGRPAMLLADRMSRRDLATQLWLIEEAVSRDDVAGALRRYDIALRVSTESQQILLPVLTSALEGHQPLATAFIPYIREPAPWLGDFARYAIRNTARPAAFAALFERAGGLPHDTAFAALESELLKRLADTGAFAEAAQYYATLDGADPAVLRTAAFTRASTNDRFAPVTWEIYMNSGVRTSFASADNSDAIELHVSTETAVLSAIARKLILLPAGHYRFRAEQWLTAASDGAQASWEMRCSSVRDGVPIWSGAAPLSEQRRAVEGMVVIPAGCGAVTLRLLTAAGSAPDSTEAVFAAVSLSPMRN